MLLNFSHTPHAPMRAWYTACGLASSDAILRLIILDWLIGLFADGFAHPGVDAKDQARHPSSQCVVPAQHRRLHDSGSQQQMPPRRVQVAPELGGSSVSAMIVCYRLRVHVHIKRRPRSASNQAIRRVTASAVVPNEGPRSGISACCHSSCSYNVRAAIAAFGWY